MEEFCLPRDDARDLLFTGELLAEADNMHNSDRTGRWWELALYRTQGGKYVVSRIGCTRWEGERDTAEAIVADNIEDVFTFLGAGPVAKALYHNADVAFVERVA